MISVDSKLHKSDAGPLKIIAYNEKPYTTHALQNQTLSISVHVKVNDFLRRLSCAFLFFLSNCFFISLTSQFIQHNLLENNKDDLLQDINDHAPKFNRSVYNKSIEENSHVGSELVK